MRRKFLLMTFLTLLFTAIGTGALYAQDNVVTIGSITNVLSGDVPLCNNYEYSISQQYYLSDEIGESKNGDKITHVAFYADEDDDFHYARSLTIYMVNTEDSYFVHENNNNYTKQLDASNTVFTGNVDFKEGEWNRIELNTPFQYTGKNILLCVVDNTNKWEGTEDNLGHDKFECFSYKGDGTYRSIFKSNPNNNYDPTASEIKGTLSEQVPCVQFTFEAASTAQTYTYAEFNALIKDNGSYDGTADETVVILKDSERSYQNNKTAQFFIGATNVNITDPVETVNVTGVTFMFEDDDLTNAYTSGELQIFAKDIVFTNCKFIGTAVSPWGKSNSENAETATFTNCTWQDLSGRYGVHQNRASELTVTGCTFENCERGIHTNSSTVASITITNNTFTGIGADYGVLCLAENGNVGNATLSITGNTAEGQVFLRQLNTTTTYAQVSEILDTENNTYGTAYVDGSTEPAAPVAKIGETPYYTLAEAVAAAQDKDVIEIIKEGDYTLPEFAGKELTFKGTTPKEHTSITDWVNKASQGMMGSTVHFESLTISGQTENYYGLFHTNAVTYKDCNINGLRFLYSPTTFEDCAFNANGVEHSFWTYGASNVTVNNCTFRYTDRAVNCYSENGANHELDITFEKCSFTYAGTNATPEGAVEINSGSVKSIDLVMDECTAPENGAMWFNSQWDSKEGVNTVVIVDDVVVWTAPAKIGETRYATLQEAVDAAVDGDVVTLHADNAENVTVTQKPDVKFTIDGADKTMTGTITIDGKSAAYATAGITVKNMNFTAATEAICINLGVSGNNNTRYTSNVTVESCNFTGTDKTAVGIKSYTGGDKNLIVNDCNATGMHSLMQLKNTAGVSVTDCEITDSKNGISLGASSDVAINETTVDCDGYGVRADANGDNGNATITDCTIEAFIPVVVRNASKDYALQFDGENTMTATNEDGLWCAIGTKEYEENGTMPTAPTGDVTVTLNDTGLSMDGVYGEHFALNGEGTAESPYLINNLYELKGFRDQVNAGINYAGKYVKLAADIDLNNEEWTPIGNDPNKFEGYFDGNNKTISNLKVTGNTRYKGFFGYIKGTGMYATTIPSVKDLTLDGVNVNVEGDGYYVGGLAGQAFTCNITNVTVKGNVSGVRYVGGLVGHVYTYFKDCHFIGNASCSFDALGGIAGAGDCRAYDCSVIGDITGSNWVGGIVGNGQEGTSAVGCYVKGDVKTATNWYFGVGGIAGVAGHGYSSSEFKNNYFDGEVYLEGEKVPAMIIGIVNAENNETINATIEGNSWNTEHYDAETPVYVTAESPQDGTTEDWIAGASEELTKPRNNNLVMLESDLQYVTEEDYVIMSFSEVTEEQVEQALINNAVAKIGETTYTTLQKALDAAAAGTGNVTVEIIKDIDLTNVDWNPVTVSAPGYPVVTVNGNNKTITGLNDMLFAGTWAGNSGLIINDLTIANSTIVNDKDDNEGTVGVGAFIGYPQASETITLNNCHLKDSHVEGGHWTGGLIGIAGGYSGTDGPVFMNLTITGCSVTGSTITGKGSAGGVIAHGTNDPWTNLSIESTTVSGNSVISTGSSTNKAGAVMGTIGAAGQPTTVNGVTKTGGMSVSATVAENDVKSNGTEITTIYGRQGTPTGMLELAGGSYDNYPIEEGVDYAAPVEGFKIEENEDGTYGVVVDPAYGKVAKVGDVYYETLAEAYNAATDGKTITLLDNITLSEKFVIARSITLDGNDKTLTYTGTDRAIDVPNDANANIDVTVKNLTVVATTANRGLNYNENGEFNVEGVTVTIGENVDGYAINFPGMADNAQVTIKDSKLTSRNPLNIWGENMVINVYDSEIISVDNSSTYDYAAIQLNNDNYGNVANGTVVNVYGGTITALNDNDEPSNVVANATETGVVNISDETIVTGKVLNYVANIGGVYFGSLQAAVNAIEKYGYNSPIVIMKSFATSETATVKNGLNVTIDLNGKTITVTDNTTKNFEAIKNQGTLTIKDSSADKTGKIIVTATTNSGWNRYSAVIANTVGGKLTVDGGTLEHLGGTDMAYAIDNLTNGQGTYAETIINGGTMKSPYRAIRQFLNGIEAQNILTVNGGTIEGTNKSIWMQDPSAKANTGTLTVGEGATLKGDVYLSVTEGSTEWPVEVSIAAEALQGESTVMTNGNVPAGYELQQDADGNYVVNQGVAKIGEVLYATVTEAINAAENGGTVQLLALTIDEYVAPWATDTQHTSEKSITIIGAENFGTTMTGGLYLGYDDSQCREHTIVVKGINFTGKGILVASQQNVIVEGNKFTDITDHVASSGSAGKNAISIIGKDVIATVKNNVITTTASVGIDLRNILTATVDGNTVTGTQHNSMQIQNASANSSAEIANNRFFDWGKSGEGRAMRINQIVTADVNNNVMINVNAPEEFVKITGHTTAEIDENYWNGANPTSSNTPAYFLAEGVQVHNYYAAYDEESNTLSGLVTIEGAGETFEKFYTAAGVETTQDQAAYSLMFKVTDYANNEVSVKIGSKKPAQNSNINLVTPSEVQFEDLTFNVTSVADNGFNGTRFKTITISDGVRTLGTKALANMYDLTSVVFPSTLESVGDNCFHGYGDSHKIKSITSYADEAPAASGNWQTVPFQQCIADVAVLIVPNALSYTEYKESAGWSRFKNIIGIGSTKEIAGKDDKYTLLATVTSMNPMESSIQIGNTKPASNSNAELVLPEVVDYFPSVEGLDFTVTSIPNNAFSSCLYFVGDLVIPQNVRTIGAGAFNTSHFVANETVRGTLTLNEGLVSIGSQAFKKDYFKGDLSIPSTVETIASNAFQYASFDGILTINGNINCANAFGGTGFTELVLVEGVEEIKDSNAFSGMTELKEVVLPLTLQTVGMAAFKDDDAIEVIHTYATEVPAINSIPGNVNYKYAFSETVKANAVLYVHGTSYDDVLKYKNATNEWNEFANIHLYGAVAQIGEVEYLTIQEAIAAATSGQTITLLADVEAADGNPVLIPEGVTLDINTHNVTANIYGTVKTSGGLWTTVTVPGFNSRKMLGNGAIYNTTDATVANSASEVKMLAGSIVLNPNPETEWWTLPSQNLSIASGASFEVPANIKFTVRENTHVVVDGTLTVNGVVYLQMGATVEAAVADLNILTDVEGYMVSYEDGVYSVVQAIYTQTRELAQGWNWFSYYVDTDLTALETALGENGVQITSKTDGFVAYNSQYGWSGNLSSITESQMYMINVGASHDLELSGELVGPTSITLHQGWNWIGFPMSEAVSVTDALAGFEAKPGDQIKSKDNGFASYNSQYGWGGALSTLNPGEGYMYQSNNSETTELFYSAGTRGELKANITTDGNHWIPNAGQYPNNMTMTAMVEVEGGDYEVAAFVNGECRGSARPIYIEALDAHILFLTIHGEDVEEMTFRYYDIATGEEFDLNDRMNYSNDAIVGTLAEPYIFSRGTIGIGEASLSDINIYPNPTTTGTEINLQSTCDTVEVFNALGVKVAEYHNVDSIDAFETAGIYVIRLTNNGDVKHCRLIVK